MLCKLNHIADIKQQIISNIKKSGQTPDFAIPTPDKINVNDWELECDKKGNIIAQGNLYSNEGDWYSCTLQKLFVADKFRGKGLGDKIVKRLIFKARNKKDHGYNDCQILTADIDRTNVSSRNLFEKNGFRIQNSFCTPGDGSKADVLRMTLSGVNKCGRN